MRNFTKGMAACIGIAMAATAWVGCARSENALDQVNLSTADIQFVRAAAISNYGELTLAVLDTTRSTDSAMKAFGAMMITDHTAAGTELKTLATNFGLSAPDSLDANHQALQANLMTLSGRAFDSVYIHNMVADHQAAVDLFNAEASGGQQQQLKLFATNLLPTLQMHLDEATAMAADY